VKRWEDVAVPDGPIYNGYDPQEREEIDPTNHPLHDETDQENFIFDAEGFRIPRRRPILTTTQSWGVLADLTSIRSMFDDDFVLIENEDSEDDEMEDIDDAPPSTRVDVYPQAGLRTLGHFKANNVPNGFKSILKRLDRQWAANRDAQNPIIRGLSCQGYNDVQHCLSDRAGAIEVLHGQLTAAMAGMEGDARCRRLKEKLITQMNTSLPFAFVSHKLDKREISRAFRVEINFDLNIQALSEDDQDGGWVLPFLLNCSDNHG
jgi:hypothetical protein